MDDRSKASPPANIGISLLVSVFLVLCLFTFSTIAMLQAENEWHRANLTKDSRLAYYEACNKAEQDKYELNLGLAEGETPQKKIKRKYDISDISAISVVFTYDESEKKYRFSKFQTIETKTWKGDDTLNVIR